jgi:hypothetical protein
MVSGLAALAQGFAQRVQAHRPFRLGCRCCAAFELSHSVMHWPHCTQANIRRLMLRGVRRMGQAWSQAAPPGALSVLQLRQSRARLRSKAITRPFGLAIQARLWNRPTAQPKRQNRWRANRNSSVKTALPMAMKRAWLGVSEPCTRLPQTCAGGSR